MTQDCQDTIDNGGARHRTSFQDRLLSASAVVTDMSLLGKVAVVTGSSGGIGAAIAMTLATAGAKVVLGARRVEELEKVKSKIEGVVGSDMVIVCKADVTKRDEVKALVAAAEAGFGPVDIMVNNAGERLLGAQLAWLTFGTGLQSSSVAYMRRAPTNNRPEYFSHTVFVTAVVDAFGYP